MDYSKWKKILVILMIINLIWIFYNRVFAVTTEDYYYTRFNINPNEPYVTLGSSDYGGQRFIALSEFMYEYNNIVISMYVNYRNVNTKVCYLIFSNSNITLSSTGQLKGVPNQTYYCKNLPSIYDNSPIDLSNTTLSDYSTFTPSSEGSYARCYCIWL